jgi:glucokinase
MIPTMIGSVDIGGTKIAVGLVDHKGHIHTQRQTPSAALATPQEGIRAISDMLHAMLDEAGARLEGIGIGCTGPVYPLTGTVGWVEFLPSWEGADLITPLAAEFGVPAALENDADAAALGEWVWGAGQGSQTFLLVTVGTGIGTGLITGGQLYRGVDGAHPEIGHMVIDPGGPPCFCGAHGCWESLASGPSMARLAQAEHPQGLYRTGAELCSAALTGDELAQQAVDRTASYLGLGLANLVTLFTPEVIALGGGLMQALPQFRPGIDAVIDSMCRLVPKEKVRIVPARFGAQAGIVGAARVGMVAQRSETDEVAQRHSASEWDE